MHRDLILAGGTVIDGTGAVPLQGTLTLSGGKIKALESGPPGSDSY